MQVTMEQIQELADRYDECGLGGTGSGRFLRSIVTSGCMPRGRGVNWLNDLISRGNPQVVAPLVDEITKLIERSHRHDTKEILADILLRVKAGRPLTDHKKSELERLRKQVNDALPDLALEGRQALLMRGLINRKRHMRAGYWYGRPVVSGRLDNIFKRWEMEGKVSSDDWSFICDNFKTIITSFNQERHPVGALRWLRSGQAVTVMSETQFNDSGEVFVEVLASNGPRQCLVDRLLIRTPKIL